MLTIHEMQTHLKRLTYRPGWVFDIYQGAWEGPHLSIHVTLEDNLNPGQPVDLGFESFLPPMPSLDYFELWLAKRLERIEVHEMREAFKRDGRVIFDPHAEFADRDQW